MRHAEVNTPDFRTRPRSFDERLREIDMFFQGTDPVHQTLRRVTGQLEAAGIPYAVIGGMAINAHGVQRTTGDVDLLLTAEGLKAFRRLLVPGEFDLVPGRRRRFKDRSNGVTFDILVTGTHPGMGKPGPITFPAPDAVAVVMGDRRVVNLPTLIELKLAARRHKDFGDVVDLIRVHQLDEAYVGHLHPAVHRDFIECLEEKRREDEYEAREAMEDDANDAPTSGE
jgi:hypothetical protein